MNKKTEKLKTEAKIKTDLANKKRLEGEVVSDRSDKTITVEIKRHKIHPIYRKKFPVNKKFLVDDHQNRYQVGDMVLIEEVRPISKRKRFRVVKK